MKNITEIINEALVDRAQIFIIIKPGFSKYSQQILERFFEDGWTVKHQRSKKLLVSEAKRLYKIHKEEDWYKDLVDYMSSDITTAFILENKTMKMSKDVFDKVSSIKDELREEYGESDMRNVLHSSDSMEHMIAEKAVYF